jgi:hypothetical protein
LFSAPGGDDLYDDISRYDPPTPENGNLTLRDRYEAWAAANHVDIPVNGAAVRPGGPVLP